MTSVSEEYGFYHICSDGNALPWLFKDDEDFIAGINRIGICKHVTGVEIISFILKIDIDAAQGNRTFISDKELRPIVIRMSENMFQTSDIKSLNVNNRLILARKLRHEYASTTKQISRMVFLDPEILKGFV